MEDQTTYSRPPADEEIRNRRLKHSISTGLIVGIVASVILILGVSLTMNPNQSPDALTGKKAAGFKVAWIQGKELLASANDSFVTLDDFKGRPVVLNFWASWCVSCRQEAHLLEEFWKMNRSNDVVFVGIAIHDTITNASDFARAFGKTYYLGLDEDGKAAIDYGVTGVPETFFIDRQGIIRHKKAGPVDAQTLNTYLAKIN